MEVMPAGYKQTEVGLIPVDWGVSLLRECCSKITDGTHDTPKPIRSGVPFLTAIHVKDNWIDFESCLYLTKSDHMIIYSRCNPQKNDVLMVNIGAGVATTALVEVDYEFSLKNVALLKPDARTVGSYLNYSLVQRKPKITNDLLSGGAQPFLSLAQIGGIKIPLPPTKAEQEAIAEALSDVDALIDGLDKLIAKKRDLKQAAMQQLLTGQTRLPSFQGEWKIKRLGQVAGIKTGNRNNEDKSDDGQYPFFVRSDVIERINSYSYECEAILVPGEGKIGSIFHYIQGRFDVHQRVYAITDFMTDVSSRFVHLYMKKNFGTWAMQNTVKATVDSLRLPTFKTFEMHVPPTLGEQAAIAEVLTDMEAEIAALEQRRGKTRALKQGMMQELLTGKTRLI